MAIKIISKGKEPDNPIFTQRCPKCDCVFTYQKEDAHRKPTGGYYQDFDIDFMNDWRLRIIVSIECPWCHKKIYLKDEYI